MFTFQLYQKILSYTSKIQLRDYYLCYLTSVGIGVGLAVAKISWFYLLLSVNIALILLLMRLKQNVFCIDNPHKIFIMIFLLLIGFLVMEFRLQNFTKQIPQANFWYRAQGQVSYIKHYDSGSAWIVLENLAVKSGYRSPRWQTLDKNITLRILAKNQKLCNKNTLSTKLLKIQRHDQLTLSNIKLNNTTSKQQRKQKTNIYNVLPSVFSFISCGQIIDIRPNTASYINAWYRRVTDQTNFMSDSGQAFIQAVLTGQRQSTAFNDLIEIIRPSGLGHIVAISGLHMSLLANFVFWLVFLIVSYFSCVYLRFSLRKIAAFSSLIICFLYLMFTGFPLTAQRAFLMISVMFLAIILDRRARGIRTLSLGGLCLLLLWPEYLLHIGLQFSFMSVLILLCLYEDYQQTYSVTQKPTKGNSYFSRLIWFLYANFLLTIVVNLIQIYHFSVIYPYSIINNSLVLPIFTLIIMPLIFLSIPFIICGFAYPVLHVIDWFLQWLLMVINWTLDLPFNSISVHLDTELWLILFCSFYCCFLFKRITYKPGLILVFILSMCNSVGI